MKEIPLTQGKVALVDDEDYESVACHSWCAQCRQYRYRQAIYAQGKVGKEVVRMHRFVLGLQTGDGLEVDHINGDTLDNRRCNLRVCSHSDNMYGARYRLPSCGFRGVRKKCSQWEARLCYHGRLISIGLFRTPEEAHWAYLQESRHLRGYFRQELVS